MKSKFSLNALLVAIFGLWSPCAKAVTYTYFGFENITHTTSPDVANQLFVGVFDAGVVAGVPSVGFTFFNNTASSITVIYFDDGFLRLPAQVSSSLGVKFAPAANPASLPGGNNATPPFVTSKEFDASTLTGNPALGVDGSADWVTLTFGLGVSTSYPDFSSVLSALENPTDGVLRIGLHVTSIGPNSGSDSFVNTPTGSPTPPVPDGGSTVALLGLAVLGIGGLRRLFSMN